MFFSGSQTTRRGINTTWPKIPLLPLYRRHSTAVLSRLHGLIFAKRTEAFGLCKTCSQTCNIRLFRSPNRNSSPPRAIISVSYPEIALALSPTGNPFSPSHIF